MGCCSGITHSSVLSNVGVGAVAVVSGVAFCVANVLMDQSITMLKVFGKYCPTSSYKSGHYYTEACMSLGASIFRHDLASKGLYIFFGATAIGFTYALWKTRPVQQLNEGEGDPLIQNVPFVSTTSPEG